MIDVVFLGYCVPIDDMKGNPGLSVAGNKMQWNFIHNLNEFDDINLSVISVYPRCPFPKSNVIFNRKQILSLDNKIQAISVPYINLPFFKQITQIISVYFSAKSKCIGKDELIILTFNVFPQIGIPMRWLKRKFKNTKNLCILADLPIDDNSERKGISKALRKIFDKSTEKSISICDSFIVLNKYVAHNYVPNKNYIVIDGGVDKESIKPYFYKRVLNKNVFFCGALTEYNGIRNLIDAMNYVNADITLDIYGTGLLQEYVVNAAKNNPKIHYMGAVSNEEVIELQKNAWLLINPRIIDDHISKVTFPSKTFEYLLSCRPVLSTKLNCFDEEYSGLMFLTGDTPMEIAESINRISKLDEQTLKDITRRAYDFIVSRRTWDYQVDTVRKYMVSL